MKNRKYKIIISIFIVLLIMSIAISFMTGNYSMKILDVISTLSGNGNKYQEFTLYQLRLPRIVLAILVSFALATSGVILQAITKNPLAEPGMIGINAGAALFVVIFISLGTNTYYSSLTQSSKLMIPLVAIAGSIFAAVIVYALAYKGNISPVRFVLCGIGLNAGINAIITFYQLNISKGDFNQVLTWTNGSLWGSSWDYIIPASPFIIILIVFTFCRHKILDLLYLGDEISVGLGISLTKENIIFIITATLLAGVATSVAGNIAFLALLGPRIAKKLVGNRHLFLIPLSGTISSIILVLSDIIARTVFSPIEIPVGIVVSIVGIPYYLYLIRKKS